MTLPIRYAPSGAVISNNDGGGLKPGSGMRLRLVEAMTIMGGSLAVPAVAAVVGPDGFAVDTATVLTLDLPKDGLKYRAKLSLDLINTTTNVPAQVVLYLDTSLDGGTTWSNRARSMHVVSPDSLTLQGARNCDIYLPLTLGGDLGIDDAVPTPSIKLRARANLPLGTAGDVVASSAAASGGTSVTSLNGTIHMELEECF